MQNVNKKFRTWGAFLFLLFFAVCVSVFFSATRVKADTETGFVTINGKSYYINKDGSKQKGWLELDGKKYYFNASTGVQVKGWATDSKGRKRYFSKGTGIMMTGWLTDSKGQKRYFDESTGFMQTKWLTLKGKKYYFYSKSGVAACKEFLTDSKKNTRYFTSACYMLTGWAKNTKGEARFFEEDDGIMAKGFQKIDGKNYYFSTGSGKMATGWQTINYNKYYFDTKTGEMATGQVTIDGKKYTFDSNGILLITPESNGSKTIKNYLAGALLPVGKALYVWGGGWNDSTRKGLSPTMTAFYNSQTADYNYNNYRDLSTENRAKGFDCSGFVGWAAYQVMQTKSGVGSGYTVVSGEVGSTYKARGWGSILTQSDLSKSDWTFKPGDIGYNEGHVWIVLGQCSDKSLVIVHSTPNAGVKIAGTPTPNGTYGSQAIALAQKYMSRYPGYAKYGSAYHTSSGNYSRNGNYFRWNRNTLSDPDGYLSKTADQILADLFS